MANEIYSSSYWGNGVCDNTIDWGVVYKDYAGCTPTFTNTYSLAFDGVDDFLDTGAIDLGETNTISFWFKNNSANTGNAIIGDANDNVVYFQSSNLFYYPTGSITGRKKFIGTNIASAMADTTNWHNIIFIRKAPTNGTNGFNDLACYLDGNLEGTFVDVYTANINLIPVYIGKSGTGFPLYEGLIDEVSYYDNDQTANISTISTSPVVDLTSLNPVAWYRNGDNGTWKSPQWLIPNNINVANSRFSNYSFLYDGVDDYVNCGDVLHNDGQTPMTLSAWINITNTGDYPIAGKKKVRAAPLYARRGWDVTIDTAGISANKLTFTLVGVDSGGSNIGTIQTKANGFAFTDGLWHHVVVTYDGSEDASGVKFYRDGVEDTNIQIITNTFSGNSVNDPSVDFKIGTKPEYSGSSFYDGSMDELAIWSTTALTQEQVTTLYNSGVPTDISSLSPISHWRMGEDATFSTNWTVTDNGSASNDGTSANMTIEDRVGDASNSSNNAVSFNQVEADRKTDVPT